MQPNFRRRDLWRRHRAGPHNRSGPTTDQASGSLACSQVALRRGRQQVKPSQVKPSKSSQVRLSQASQVKQACKQVKSSQQVKPVKSSKPGQAKQFKSSQVMPSQAKSCQAKQVKQASKSSQASQVKQARQASKSSQASKASQASQVKQVRPSQASQAKPSHAKPSHAKPSQVMPSQVMPSQVLFCSARSFKQACSPPTTHPPTHPRLTSSRSPVQSMFETVGCFWPLLISSVCPCGGVNSRWECHVSVWIYVFGGGEKDTARGIPRTHVVWAPPPESSPRFR